MAPLAANCPDWLIYTLLPFWPRRGPRCHSGHSPGHFPLYLVASPAPPAHFSEIGIGLVEPVIPVASRGNGTWFSLITQANSRNSRESRGFWNKTKNAAKYWFSCLSRLYPRFCQSILPLVFYKKRIHHPLWLSCLGQTKAAHRQ